MNNDGSRALDSGDVTVQVTVLAPVLTSVPTPTLSGWAMIALGGLLGGMGYLAINRRCS